MYSFHDDTVNPNNQKKKKIFHVQSISRPIQLLLWQPQQTVLPTQCRQRETLTQVCFGRAVMLMSQRAESLKPRISASHLIHRQIRSKPFNWSLGDRRNPTATQILFQPEDHLTLNTGWNNLLKEAQKVSQSAARQSLEVKSDCIRNVQRARGPLTE